jgi:hypothetical protein
MNQIHIISARSRAGQVVHRRRLLDRTVLSQVQIQLNVPLASRTRQPHGSLRVIARQARRSKRLRRSERLLPARSGGRRLAAARGEAAESRSHFLAEEVENRSRDSRHASANDSKVALEAAPERDVVVVVGGVGDLAEGGEVAEPHNAADGREEADEESGDDSGFAPGILDLQADQFGDWEEEDDQVEEDVEGAVDVDCGLGDGTLALVLAVPASPEKRNGPALDGEVDDEAEEVSDQRGDDGPTDVSESLGDGSREDAKVEKDDGDLGRDDDELVDVLFKVEQLEHQGDAAWVDGPDVSAHAMVDHDVDKDGGRDDTSPGHQDHPVVPSDAGALDEPTC